THLSIPDHDTGAGARPLSLQAYNIHVNGVLHCRVRYSQLLGLHEQLRKEYGANVVPAFPPKKIFTLTPAEVEQRREQLEKYMQAGKLSSLPCSVPCGAARTSQGSPGV
uniref:PX domain-containing protein n=1 Tax=Zonotrichia albicollis TaxID=44394 RepID=A0A8D2M9N5_ZONAL